MKFPFKSIAFIAFLILAMFQTSCKSDDDNNEPECFNVACPTDVYIIYVSIIDENQDPVALESYEVINIETGNVLTSPIPPAILVEYQQSGEYPLVTGSVEVNQEKDLLFKGYVNDIEVISSSYKVRGGCCQIGLVSGDTTLVLE